MLAHLFMNKGRLDWSGHNATGDFRHTPFAVVVDTGRDFYLTSDKAPALTLVGPGPARFELFSPEAVVIAARSRMFGFWIVEEAQTEALAADKRRVAIRKIAVRSRPKEATR
jgi:hypothetical protein